MNKIFLTPILQLSSSMDVFTARALQRVQLYSLPFEGVKDVTEEEQNDFLKKLVLISKSNPYYASQILQKLLNIWPTASDEYYEYLSEWIASVPLSPTSIDTVIYTIGDHLIHMKECPSVIASGGTTGNRTWEAALALSEYLQNIDIKGNVLELGCGTGMVSIAMIMKNKSFLTNNHLFITDGDENVVNIAENNYNLNLPNNANVVFQTLFWGTDPVPQVDTILAADVTYDSSVIPSLVETFVQSGAKRVLLAATRRNINTLQTFENSITEHNWNYTVEELPFPYRLMSTLSVPVLLYVIDLY